ALGRVIGHHPPHHDHLVCRRHPGVNHVFRARDGTAGTPAALPRSQGQPRGARKRGGGVPAGGPARGSSGAVPQWYHGCPGTVPATPAAPQCTSPITPRRAAVLDSPYVIGG